MQLKYLFFIPFFMIFLASAGFSQISEGEIIYEYRVDMHRNIPPEREELKAMVPQYRTQNFSLVFNADERFYKPVVNPDDMVQGRGGGRRMGFGSSGMEIYSNNQTQEWVGMQDFMGRNYLILDSLYLAPWRMGNELMDIAGYRCQLAWYTDTITNEDVTAWFTFDIQPFLGPDMYVSLPGAILAIDINNGEKVWVARSIEARTVNANEIKKPTRGEEISRNDFRKLTEEQMEKLRERRGF